MSSFFRGLIDALKLPADGDEEELNDYVDEELLKKKAPSTVSSSPKPAYSSVPSGTNVKPAHSASNFGSSTYIESRNNNKTLRMERPEGSKVVPLKTTGRGYEVCVMKPRVFEDSQDICDVLLSECCAIVILQDIDLELAQRIMDFVSGSVYSVNGKLYQISDYTFIIAPGYIDVSGDYNDILAQSGYDVPILNR